ncbi:hypothetical protein VTN31DRAFT_3621 [Thermomyces dupontii]|uniref:uncharacterized protein n=1 Tax=Talaromyces thermophilus TaxID=28565 RepID=UPI0037432F61
MAEREQKPSLGFVGPEDPKTDSDVNVSLSNACEAHERRYLVNLTSRGHPESHTP